MDTTEVSTSTRSHEARLEATNERAIEIITSIRSHETRLKAADERAIAAIGSSEYWVAMTAIIEAAEHKGAIKELEYQLELMEV